MPSITTYTLSHAKKKQEETWQNKKNRIGEEEQAFEFSVYIAIG
jgi:hypothetical protein